MTTSAWGELRIADAHVHFFSPAFFQSLPEKAGALLGWEVPSSAAELAARWIAEMDRYGVSTAMLIASIPNDTASVNAAVTAFPDRFRAISMTNPLLPASVNPAGKETIFLFPAMHRYSLHDDKVAALVEAAALVYVHCGALSVGFRKKLGLPSQFDMRFSNPVDLHALAAAFPKVNFVIPHFGAGYFREALMVADLCPNVYLDTSSSNRWMKYQSGDMDLRRVFRMALDVVGPGRLLFGSDSSWFPRGWVPKIFEEQAAVLAELGVSEETARAVFGGNLMRISQGSATTTTATL